jgi:hypothetical protein
MKERIDEKAEKAQMSKDLKSKMSLIEGAREIKQLEEKII